MRLRSLGLGEFEIVHEVGDNVLYHSQAGLISPRLQRVDYRNQTISLEPGCKFPISPFVDGFMISELLIGSASVLGWPADRIP
jgi:hypothetical protein